MGFVENPGWEGRNKLARAVTVCTGTLPCTINRCRVGTLSIMPTSTLHSYNSSAFLRHTGMAASSPHYNPTLLSLYLPWEELIGKDARSSFVTCVSIYYAQLEIAASSTSCKQSMMKRRKSLNARTNIRKQLIAKNNLGGKEQQFIETRLALKQSL